MTVLGLRCLVTEQKKGISQVISCVCYFAQPSVALCVWHMADMLSGECERQSDPLPLTEASKPGSLEGLR